MAVLQVSNAALIRIQWSGGGRVWENVLGAVGNPTLPTFDQTLADALSTAYGAALSSGGILPLLSTGVTFVELGIRSINTANQVEYTSNAGEMAGTGVGDLLPLSVAAVATLRTALAGKSYRGRTYFSGFTEAENDASGRSLAAVNTAIKNVLDQFNAALAGHSLALAVVSRPADPKVKPQINFPGRAGQVNRVVSVDTRNTKWESQRRRTGRA